MKIIKYTLIIFLFYTFTGCSEDKIDFVEYGIITGKVVKATNFEPIENAKVTLSPSNNSTFTDVDGNYEFTEVAEGNYSVQAEMDLFVTKFEPTTVSADQTVNVIIELEKSDALNKPPTVPVLISPQDNSTNLGVEVMLNWNESTDLDNDEVFYTIEIRNDLDNEIIRIESITETTYTITNLEYGVKYFWQVFATDTINSAVLSTTFTFETDDFPNHRFLYVQEENGNNVIYSSDENGNAIAITNTNENSWRPRKNNTIQRIAFLKTFNSETHLFTMNPNGTDIQQVTSSIPPASFKQSEVDFAWSTNGNKLIYANFDKLYTIHADGSGIQLLYQTNDGSFITECDWSNDENLIALKTNNSAGYNVSIFTIDLTGTILHTVLSGVNGACGGLNISVDNQKLLYTYDISGFENAAYRILNSHVFIYDLNTNTTVDYSNYKINGTNDLDPRFSPNESQIILVNTSNDGISQKNIYTIDIVDDEERHALFNSASMPDWE